ncbi:MAG: filamentous hemagglutinin N-terminal domain-containing protein, partial [Leptolyngbya sp. SIO4C5]|nr:filamentous hemagglutinin N-terminal domain-containing protein [Leptolyngbya sp. SIO4C5]
MFLTPRRITHWVGLWASTALVPTAALAQSITPATDGTGTQINQNGDRYTITGGSAAGNNLFHSFQEFNLNGAEAANFLAAPTVENILGRIRGGNPTAIDGLLQVTGTQANLYLMNPAGVLFGPNARLDLPAAFGVTTADGIGFSNGWFSAFSSSDYAALVGDPTQFAFTQTTPGPIVNAGQLRVEPGESIMLLGGSVINTGTLSAPGGEVTIAAIPGESLVRISHDGLLLNLEVEAIASNAAIAPNPITPSTLPELLTGSIPSSATGITLNPDGTVTLSGSEIAAPVAPGTTLVAGTVDVADPFVGSGGAINLLGQTVGVLAAQVEASGAAGGGDIRIGGGYQGREAVPNAEMTVISEGTTVRADALSNGNGGRVIVWSDLATRIYGDLSAIGGALGGNGGLIETSSLGQLDIQTAPDVSAAQDSGGTWLIDPPTLFIGASSSSNLEGTNTAFNPANSNIDSVLNIDTLLAALAPDNITVIVSTVSNPGGVLRVGGDIVLNQPLIYNAGNASALVLQAAENININAAITTAAGSPLSLTFQADTDFTGNGQVQINNNILTSGGSITATGNTTALGAEPAIAIASGVNINTGVGDINLTALGSGGGIQANSPLVSTGGNVNLNAANTSIAVQDINSGSGNISATTQGDLTVGNILSGGRVELTSNNANIQANTVNATAGS